MRAETLNIVKHLMGAFNHGRSHSGNRLFSLARTIALKIFQTHSGIPPLVNHGNTYRLATAMVTMQRINPV